MVNIYDRTVFFIPMLENINTYLLIIAAVVILVILYVFYKRRYKHDDKNVPYIAKTAPGAQQNYEEMLRDKNQLTQDEKLELSWQFLYDITDVVLNKFSEEDRGVVHELGHQIINQGGGYEHIIDYGIKKAKKKSRLSEEQEKTSDIQIKI